MKVDDEVDEEEVKLWDTKCMEEEVWALCVGGSGMREVPWNGLLWPIL